MVKKFQRRRENDPEEEDNLSDNELEGGEKDFEDLSDLEIVDPAAVMEENKETSINDPEALNLLADTLKNDFANYLKMKGLKTGNWIETLALSANEGIDDKLNVDDDIRRELVLYESNLI